MRDWLVLLGILVFLVVMMSVDTGRESDAVLSAVRHRDARGRDLAERAPPEDRAWTPVELSLLGGGRDLAGVLLAGPIAAGELRRASPDGPASARWHPAAGGDAQHLWQLAGPARDGTAPVREALVEQGYLRGMDPARPAPLDVVPPRWRTAVRAATVGLVLPFLAVLAADHAWVRTAVATAATLAVAAWLRTERIDEFTFRYQLGPATPKGDLALSRAAAAHAGLDPRGMPPDAGYAPDTAALAVALFGSRAMARIHPQFWFDLREPVPEDVGPGEGAF